MPRPQRYLARATCLVAPSYGALIAILNFLLLQTSVEEESASI
jgi:hypothetical protein